MTTEAKVGAFLLGCFAILAFTVVYLLNAQFSGHTVPYRTYLRYAGGLEPGASVLFGGITAGKVTAVRPWTTDPTRIEILLEQNGTSHAGERGAEARVPKVENINEIRLRQPRVLRGHTLAVIPQRGGGRLARL